MRLKSELYKKEQDDITDKITSTSAYNQTLCGYEKTQL